MPTVKRRGIGGRGATNSRKTVQQEVFDRGGGKATGHALEIDNLETGRLVDMKDTYETEVRMPDS